VGEEIFMLKDFNQEYLGIPCGTEREGIRLCKCHYRDIPLNKKYFYKVIAANCEGEPVISYSPEVEEQELDWLIRNIDFSRIGEQDVPLELQLPKSWDLQWRSKNWCLQRSRGGQQHESDSFKKLC
jgi:hypothetical protein